MDAIRELHIADSLELYGNGDVSADGGSQVIANAPPYVLPSCTSIDVPASPEVTMLPVYLFAGGTVQPLSSREKNRAPEAALDGTTTQAMEGGATTAPEITKNSKNRWPVKSRNKQRSPSDTAGVTGAGSNAAGVAGTRAEGDGDGVERDGK